MSQELLYTSAPRGLKPGSRGFCTVLSTQGMPAPLATALEGLSGYRLISSAGDKGANRNPIVYSHLILPAGGRTLNVLSRIAEFGLDYSQRANKLAHHVVLDKTELLPGGPANLLSMPDFMREQWQGEPKVVAFKPVKREGRLPSGPCRAWEERTGDAGWAGVLAESFLRDPERLVFLMFAPGQEILPLFAEALSLLPVERRWNVTFSTYFTGLVPGTTCVWRAMVYDSKEAHESLRFVQALRVDLTSGSLGPARGGALVEAARTGVRPHDAKPRPAPPIGPAEEESVELEDAQVEFATDEHPAAETHFAGIPQRPPQLVSGRNSLPTTAAPQSRSGRRLADVIEAESRRWLWITLSTVVLLIATFIGIGIGIGRIDLAKLLPKPALPPQSLADPSESNSPDGVLTFKTAPDFGKPSDKGADNKYDQKEAVDDGDGRTPIQDSVGTVTQGNEADPVFTSGSVAQVAEGGLAVMTVTATDADLLAQNLTYKITDTDTPDGTQFAITADGVLTFKTAPDFEKPSDKGADNKYDLKVAVDDGDGRTAIQDIAVTVTQVKPIKSPPLPSDITDQIELVSSSGLELEHPLLLVPDWLKSSIDTKKTSPSISLEIKNKGNTLDDAFATITVTSKTGETPALTTVKLRVKNLELTKQLGWCAVAMNSKESRDAKTHVIFGQFPIDVSAKQRHLKGNAPAVWQVPSPVHSDYNFRPKLFVGQLEIEIGKKRYAFQRVGDVPAYRTELECKELLSDVTKPPLGEKERLTASVEVGLFDKTPSIRVSLDKTKKAALLTKVRKELGTQLMQLRDLHKGQASRFEALVLLDTANPKQFEDVAMGIKTDIEAAVKITGQKSKENVNNLKTVQAEFELLHEAVKRHRVWVRHLDESKIVAARIWFEVTALQGNDRLKVYIVDFDDPKKGKEKTEEAN